MGPAAAFAAEQVLFQKDWPRELGHVACPVTLIHGEQNGNSPFDTVRDYCALYPTWRYVGFPEEGQLVAYARWPSVLDLLEEAVGPDPRPALPSDAIGE